MMIRDIPIGDKLHAQLAHDVLAVLSRRVDGWCVYVGAVPGHNHDLEWEMVADNGTKQQEPMARAIVKHLFRPYLDPGDLHYTR